jgi:hypothetical protein
MSVDKFCDSDKLDVTQGRETIKRQFREYSN